MALSRRGVTQEKCLAAMNARVPETVAPAVIAVAIHCMHMARSVAALGCEGRGSRSGEGAGELRENGQVSVKLDALKATHTERL